MMKDLPSKWKGVCAIVLPSPQADSCHIPSNLDQEKNLHLLQLADMYRLDMLKAACAEKIVTSLSIDNCAKK